MAFDSIKMEKNRFCFGEALVTVAWNFLDMFLVELTYPQSTGANAFYYLLTSSIIQPSIKNPGKTFPGF